MSDLTNLILVNWYLFLGVFLLGILSCLFFRNKVKDIYREFVSKAPIIRKYWSFIFIFSLALITGYIGTFRYSPVTDLSNNLSVLGQVMTLVFAAFVGYFAFLQLVEGRVQSLKLEGGNHITQREYVRAITVFEQVCSINTKDFHSLANLLELYLCQKDFNSFERKESNLQRNILDFKDRFIFLYLMIARDLLRQHIAEAQTRTTELVNFKKDHPEVFINWNFSDIKSSVSYKELPANGDAKKILDNVISYLTNGINPEEEKVRFESGNYSLT